jgi:GSH-dependent disulfide-bond oxidoreductase
MLELHHGEPNGVFLKPLIALGEKGVPFESRYFDPLSFAQHGARFAHNVESRLQLEREGPVLVHDGEIISSSFFMLEYIAESFPGVDLLPGGAYEHYCARASGQLMALGVGAAVSALGCAKYLAPALKQRDQAQLRSQLAQLEPLERRAAWLAVIDGTCSDDALAAARRWLEAPVARVEAALTKSAWLTGAAYSIADIDAFATLAPLPDLAPELANERRTPRLLEFLGRVRARPAVQAALATSRTGRAHEAFVPGPEPSRWG